MSHWSLSLWACVSATVASGAPAEPYPRAELIIEPAELSKPEVSRRFVILDARERAKYHDGHVAGAHWVDHNEWSKGFGNGDDREAWSRRLGNLGLDALARVVVYDDNFAKDAARIWWILRYWGLTDVRLLNGGWKGWQAAGLPTEIQAPPTIEPTTPRMVAVDRRLARKEKLLASLTGKTLQIVDARSDGEFCGADALTNNRAGAIPGAKHLEWSDLIDKETQRFQPASELTRLFANAGIDLHRATATHCQSGGRASVMVFGLELMGATDVSNYYRGWSEWGNVEETPVVVDQPNY